MYVRGVFIGLPQKKEENKWEFADPLPRRGGCLGLWGVCVLCVGRGWVRMRIFFFIRLFEVVTYNSCRESENKNIITSLA